MTELRPLTKLRDGTAQNEIVLGISCYITACQRFLIDRMDNSWRISLHGLEHNQKVEKIYQIYLKGNRFDTKTDALDYAEAICEQENI